jgi:hypothetical protein
MTDHITKAREANMEAGQNLTRHLHQHAPGEQDRSDRVTKHDIVMTLSHLHQAVDALIQAIAEPEQHQRRMRDAAAIYEDGFREGVSAGSGKLPTPDPDRIMHGGGTAG